MTAFTIDLAAVAPAAGKDALTAAERAILSRIAAGRTTRQISVERGVSVHTVRAQLGSIHRKLDIKHRGELVLWALDHNFGFRDKERMK